MSSFPKSPYAERGEKLSRESIRSSSGGSRLDDSNSSLRDEDDQNASGKEDSPASKDRERAKRTRSKSRERGRHIAEGNFDDHSPPPYNLRRRPQDPLPRAAATYNEDEHQRHSPPQRAVYGDDDLPNLKLIIVLVISAVALIAFLFWYGSSGSIKDELRVPRRNMSEIFVNELKDLRANSFLSQRARLWSTIRSAIKNVFNRFDPTSGLKLDKSVGERSPAVILLMADQEDDTGRATASCLANKLANITSFAITNRPEFLEIDGADFTSNDGRGNTEKKMLENRLDRYLKNKTASPVVVLRNIHRFSSEAALILHAYCDNENAPFKEAAYFFTIDCGDDQNTNTTSEESRSEPLSVASIDEKNWDRLAEACLRSKWLERGNLSVDKIAPILSRIANSAVFVFPEPKIEC